MESADYLIIGGGIAGTTAAEVLRGEDAHAKITILEAEPHVLYSRVLIPKYIKGQIQRDALFLRKISDYAEKNINFHPSSRVLKINPEKREAILENGLIFSFKKLLIASGGKPRDVLPGALKMHTLEDADKIKEALRSAKEKTALILGEGFIALEFLMLFILNGFKTHLIAKGSAWGEARLGRAGAEMLEEVFKKHGAVIHKEASAGDKIKTALTAAGVGLSRNLEAFARLPDGQAGLEVGPPVGGGILTDEFLETSRSGIFAAGDIAEFFDMIAGRRRIVGNWTNSFLQGRAAALNMLGRRVIFKNVSTYNISCLEEKLTFAGDTENFDDALEIKTGETLLRALFKTGKLKGAVLINRFNDKIEITKLIERGAEKNEVAKIFS
ncbi:MAG: FAD/NAD(P)-binding oxidoreductase [Candidatus Giovannonibacteria bacterium]|nr:FAD/NAD(P)-binding oxidoreductase [Candidatus Giovannonibacteria bacterium]